MKRPQLVSSGSLARMLKAAQDAWDHKDFQQCFDLLERAGRLDPANWRIQLNLGQSYGLRYDYAAAERCFEKAIRVAPNKTEALAAAARLSVDFAKHEIAEHYFKRALDQKDAAPETFAGLAELYERLRRLEEAGRLVDRALALSGSCAAALLIRARMHRQAGRLEEAEKVVRLILAATDRHARVRAYYELGAILDRQGRYDEAMNAWLEAKALLRPDAPQLLADLQAISSHLKQMQSDVSAEMLRRWFDSGSALGSPRRLGFLGGHSRSGTTLLEQVLDSHPDIVSVEEATIFHDDAYTRLRRQLPSNAPMLSGLEAASTQMLLASREQYFRSMDLHLGKPVGTRLLIDKNPSITVLIPVFLRVFPEIKLLIALRDPRDVCLSCFVQAHLPISTASVAYLTLEGTVEAYTRVLGVWRRLAPLLKNAFLEVKYEDTVNDLESVSRRALDFLGVPWDSRVLRFNEHALQKRIRTPTYADVTKPVFKTAVGRWRNYQKYFEPHLDKLAPFMKAFGYE